jgi:hypothetical protein
MMALFPRTLLAFALLIQAALGPAGITLDVCHGRLQWAAPEGESCCGDDGCDTASVNEPTCGCSHGSGVSEDHESPEGPNPAGPSVEAQEDCATCYQVALEGTADACETPVDTERPPATFAAIRVVPHKTVLPCPSGDQRLSRGPPRDVPRPGLLPGTFPMRI